MAKNIENIIQQAVNRAFHAGRVFNAQAQKDAYKATERRLYAIPILKEKLSADSADLHRLEAAQVPDIACRSADIIRFQRSGVRLTDDEILKVQITNLQAQVAANEHEIQIIEKGLERLKGDYYYRALPMKYFQDVPDDDVAELLNCDPSTVRRNRARLVRNIAIWLYGPEAV